jgi:hypothetical protein
MSSEIPSIAVPSKKKSGGAKAPTTPAAAEAPAPAVAAPEPVKNLSLKVCMMSDMHNNFDMTWTPIASKRFLKIQHERYDGQGCDSYKQVFVGSHDEMVADLQMCMRTYTPSSVSLFYKDIPLSWDYEKVIPMILKKEQFERKLNDHDCGDWDCDPDAHEVNDMDFRSFVENRIINILTGETMIQDCKRLYYEEELKGKDCPVLLEPLRVGETIKLGCGHYMSRDGWMGCKGNTCPLCRANQASLPSPDYL